jgi:hypothetical protein
MEGIVMSRDAARRAIRAGTVIFIAGWLSAPQAARASSAAWIRVLRESDAGVELLLVAPEPVVEDGTIRVRGFEAGGEPGFPELFEQAALVGVPGPRGARLEVLSMSSRDLGMVRPRIQPAPTTPRTRRAQEAAGQPVEEWRAVPAVPLRQAWPEAPVALDGRARLRERDIVALRFRPVQYRPDGGATFVERAHVRLAFVDRPRPAGAAIAAAEPLDAALVNAASAAGWERVRSIEAPGRRPAPAAPGTWLRVRVPQRNGDSRRGVYELTYADLRSLGVPVERADFDPRTFRMFSCGWRPVTMLADSTPASWQLDWQMQEIAIWVPGEADGSFTPDDPDDRIVFYALGSQGWEDLAGTSPDSLAYFRHPYDRSAYMWLEWNGVFGQRWTETDATPPGATDGDVSRLWQRVHQEQDTDFDVVDDLWYWKEIRDTSPVSVSFDLDLSGEAATSGNLTIKLGYGVPGGYHAVDLRLGTQALGRVEFYQSGIAPKVETFVGAGLVHGTNRLDLAIATDRASARVTDLLEFDLTWTRPLVAAGGTLEWSARPATADREVYALAGFGAAAPLVVDVTDWTHPRRLVGAAAVGSGNSTVWRALAGGGAGRRSHYIAVGAPARVGSSDLALRVPAPLRDRTSAPDMLIVTHASLRTAAERLAAHRRSHWHGGGTPDILVATTADIYENFSGGRVDPLAIRNYVKFLYRLDATPRLRYLLLFGDASRDVRQLVASSAATLVPTLEPHYADSRFDQAYAVDDWLSEMDTPRNGLTPYAVPDLGLGRLAARNLAEADRMVDKIIAYETTSGYGTWRKKVLMAADDECHPLGGCGETFHIGNTEALVDSVPADLDVVKMYLTEYEAVLGQKPKARAAFIRLWGEGCMLINYQGHGAPRQLSDEVLFLSTDVPALTNGARLPLFLPISCTVSEFDEPERQSMCEDLLASSGGGAIATIGATTPTYVGPNFSLNMTLFRQLFPDQRIVRQPLGLVFQLTKIFAPVSQGRFNETYVLLGDPSMPMVWPEAGVAMRLTSEGGELRTGNQARVSGEVVSFADTTRLVGFAGQLEVEVRGTADESGYRRPPQLYIPYDLPGAPIYRGTVPVVDGRFAFQFIVPVGAREGNKARLSAYAWSANQDATGALDSVRVVAAGTGIASRGDPRIRLRFPNERTRVKAGTPLTAEIQDENGINIQGTSLRSSLSLDFDRRSEPLDVTAQFRYAAGSDTMGTVTVALPNELGPGSHTATLIASDNLQNTSTASLDFQLVEENVVRLVNVLAFPNPFRDRTAFYFEITDPAEVEVRVFTTSGREVWHRTQRISEGQQASIVWDGVDLQEDTLANGTYIYRLQARPERAGAPRLEHVGKVVIMR